VARRGCFPAPGTPAGAYNYTPSRQGQEKIILSTSVFDFNLPQYVKVEVAVKGADGDAPFRQVGSAVIALSRACAADASPFPAYVAQ